MGVTTQHARPVSSPVYVSKTLADLRDDTLPRDQDLFYSTVKAHMPAHPSTSVLRNWLSTNRILITSSVKEASRRAVKGIRSIHTYFTPVPAPLPVVTPISLTPPSSDCLRRLLLPTRSVLRSSPRQVPGSAGLFQFLWSEIALNK